MAVDTESSRTEIRYSLHDQDSNYANYFEIHPLSGWIRQIRTINRSSTQQINLNVKVLLKAFWESRSFFPIMKIKLAFQYNWHKKKKIFSCKFLGKKANKKWKLFDCSVDYYRGRC